MTPELIGILGIGLLFLLLALEMEIGIAMAVVGFLGICLIQDLTSALHILSIVPIAQSKSYTLSVIPLFILMGQFTFVSGISQELYRSVYAWLGRFRGGLAMATIMACGGFAAVCGSSLATGATMGMVAIPEMERYRYDPRLSTGSVAAGGTLGILIPPSIGFVIYGILTEQSIGKLFMAGLVPGILLTGLFLLAIYCQCRISPALGPCGPATTLAMKVRSLGGTWATCLLFLIVMGGIYFGVFTPTEAAGIGAFSALAITFARRRLTWRTFLHCLTETGITTAMIFLIIIGASILSAFLGMTGLPMLLAETMAALPLPRHAILAAILFIFLALGCVMDCYAIMILVLPILFPVVQALQFDPIWFGVIMVIVLEAGLITPPIGLNVFVLKGACPQIPVSTVFRGIWPFLLAMLVAIVLLTLFPQIALFIPAGM